MELRLSHLIDGQARSAGDDAWLDVFEPATGQAYGHCPDGTADDVAAAVSAAERAFPA
ncbi:MAG TPA: aldehyde dehydrogenase family protein [Arenimonas sp.]|nr:aldehyde dehydrogenase family protein [Arenimonas sp.]